MADPSPPGGAPDALDAMRDALAGHFTAAVMNSLPAARERLAARLKQTQEMSQWRPLREANSLLASSYAALPPLLEAKVKERFDAKARHEDALSKTQKFSISSLKLVDDSEMQQEIAIARTSKLLQDETRRELEPLTARLEQLMQVRRLADDRNPAFPRFFCRGLLEALEELVSDAEVRLAAYGAIEPDLVKIVREVFGAVQRGDAVPEISPPASQAAGDAQPGQGVDPGAAVDAAFSRLAVDRRLNQAARTQLARLRPAVRAAALKDPALLTDPAHDANRLLDLLAALGLARTAGAAQPMAWADALGAALDGLAGEDASSAAFGTALQAVDALLAKEQDAATAAHPLSREDRGEAALAAAAQIETRLASGQHSAQAVSLVERAWKPVMIHDHEVAGAGSDAWRNDLVVLDALLWSLGNGARGERKRLIGLLPKLIASLRAGLVRAGIEAAQSEALLAEMEAIHTLLLRGQEPAAAAPPAAARRAVEPPAALREGAWLHAAATGARYRVNAVRPKSGDCILRDLEHEQWLAVRLDEMRRKLEAGAFRPVTGPGIAPAALEAAAAAPKR